MNGGGIGGKIMTDKARDKILAQVRDSLRTAFLPEVDDEAPSVIPRTDPEGDELRKIFIDELGELGVAFHHERSDAAVHDRVRSLVTGKRILTWDLSCLPYRLGEIVRQEKLIFGGEDKEVKEKAVIGLTGVHAALARTGSLVIVSAPGLPRTASLLPPTHIAVVRPGDLIPDLETFLADNLYCIPDTSNITVITGPSRTADIELAITLGVHGPGELIVILGP
jgi:L-lactate dehydrogenase complex protein LldG